MSATIVLPVVMLGLSAGLRALTPPAIIACSAYLGIIDLSSSPFSFMSSPIALAILSLLALGEYVWDLLPNTPDRTEYPGLISRVLTASFAALCVALATHNTLVLSFIGGAAAIVGAFAGIKIRSRAVRALGVADAWVAIPEDLVAVVLSIVAIWFVGFA
jgi:uncharacterized membrane protein